jgi:hypothetical protein
MTKVVINSCYGGFGLSEKAMLRLYELGSGIIEAQTPREYYGDRDDWEEQLAEELRRKERSSWDFPVLASDGMIITDRYGDEYRADPHLISVVEEMGAEANGFLAELKVVEIPDDIEWSIGEYDGVEWVDEKHRSWS